MAYMARPTGTGFSLVQLSVTRAVPKNETAHPAERAILRIVRPQAICTMRRVATPGEIDGRIGALRFQGRSVEVQRLMARKPQ